MKRTKNDQTNRTPRERQRREKAMLFVPDLPPADAVQPLQGDVGQAPADVQALFAPQTDEKPHTNDPLQQTILEKDPRGAETAPPGLAPKQRRTPPGVQQSLAGEPDQNGSKVREVDRKSLA